MENEIWKDIIDFENYYQVSNFGNIKSLERWVNSTSNSKQLRPSKILKGNIDRDGYKKVTLSKENKFKYYTIHRLVALYFIDNPENKPTVNHIDGDKLNNNDWNLEWNTISEQNKHAYSIGLNSRKGELNNCSKLKEEQVLLINELLQSLSISEISLQFNVSKSTIYDIKKGNNWNYLTNNKNILEHEG